MRLCTNGRKDNVAKCAREEHVVYSDNIEIIVITEFYEVFDTVYYVFCAGCARNELV
jgi:hypothetical protein